MTKKSIYKKSILFIHQLLPPSLWGPCSWPHICLQETLCFHGCWTERRDNITYSKSQGRQARKEWLLQVGKPESIIYRFLNMMSFSYAISNFYSTHRGTDFDPESWRNKLTPTDLQRVENSCQQLMGILDYKKVVGRKWCFKNYKLSKQGFILFSIIWWLLFSFYIPVWSGQSYIFDTHRIWVQEVET